MYDSDSFFTLSVPGQIGLAALSLMLAFVMVLLTLRVTRSLPIGLRLAVALLLFAAFDWLSPQVYYAYYRVIIPDLPLQWVIGLWPDPLASFRLLTFSVAQDLSAHGRGVLGWTMLLIPALTSLRAGLGHDSEI
jgi:hypothetical protein